MNVIEQFGALSPQQCFDISAQHILKTRQQSLEPLSPKSKVQVCVYRGSGCAASPFLTPEAQQSFSADWNSLVNEGHVPPHNKALIRALQYAHDFAQSGDVFMMDWKRRMKQLASDYSLSAKLIDEDDKS